MVSSLIHWLTFKVVIQWALAKPVTYVSNMDTNSFQDSPGRIDNVVGREVNPVLDPRCGDGSKPRVKFTRRLGQKAIDAFCDGIAGKGPNPWHYTEEYDKYGVTLRPTMQRFGTSHHFDETIFDFEVSSLAKSSKEFPFKEGSSPSYYHDCKGALKNLTSSCCSDENNCFGGAILSDQTLRYIMGARTVDADPPFFSGAIGCSPNDPALNFDKNQLQEAVKKFCKGTEGAWPLQEGTDYNTSQIPNWHRDFPKIDLLVRKIPAKWDGTDACKKGLSLPADDVTCQEVFGRLSRICTSIQRFSVTMGGWTFQRCHNWHILARRT